MLWVDWVILAIIGMSALLSLLRGFVKEALSLAGWFAAFFIAKTFYQEVAVLLEAHISLASARLATAWVLIFVAVLFTAAMLNYLISQFVSKMGLSGTDRMLGMTFGALRGVLLLAVLVLGLKVFTPVEQDPWWRESQLLPHIELLGDWFYAQTQQVMPEHSLAVPESFSEIESEFELE